jgi:hypothetical protein
MLVFNKEGVMRTIQISTEVFAAIWKARREGEPSEDAILTRLLKVETGRETSGQHRDIGYRDPRYGVEFPEGFEIFRSYLGKDRRARAVGGNWTELETGKRYPSLNELSRGIGAKTENAWINWFYLDERGNRSPVSVRRDASKIIRRKRSF